MKFSIIVPIYNVEKYLKQCIESALNQTYRNFEIILVDDGSRDQSGRICDIEAKNYPDIIKVIHQKNSGQLMARCAGIKASKGEYCLFLDADDLLDVNCLKELFEVINNKCEPDIVLYSFYYMEKSKTCRKAKFPFEEGKEYNTLNKKELYQMFFESTSLNSMCTKAIKSNVLMDRYEEFVKFSALRTSEDRLQCMVILTKAERIVCLNKELYYYRQVQGSTTREFNIETVQRFNTRILCKEEEKYLQMWGLDSEEGKKKLAAKFLNQTMYVLWNYYTHLKNKKERRLLIRYDWTSFVNPIYLKEINDNEFVNPVYRKIWNYVINKKYTLLSMYCWYREKKLDLRDIRRKIVSKYL